MQRIFFKGLRKKGKQALAYLIIICMVLACFMTTPQNTYADSTEAYLQNGINLSTLTPTPVTVFGSKDMTGGKGFLGNYYYLTGDQIGDLRNGEETAEDLGIGDSWIENVPYSAMEDHGIKTWVYSNVSGIDLQALFGHFGVTDKSVSLGVKSSDGMTYSLENAFAEDRYYFDPEGAQSADPVSPVLALLRNTKETTTAPDEGNSVDIPTEATSSTAPRLGFGQTTADEHTGCNWIKTVNKVVVGPEGTAQRALTVTSDGISKGISLWEMIRAGVYETSYTYIKDNMDVTHDLQGIPLSKLLETMDVEISNNQKIEITCSDGYSVSPISYDEIGKCFVAYEAKEEGDLLANTSALRLYRPGQFGNTVVVKNLSALTVAETTTPEEQIDYTVYYYQTKARVANNDVKIPGWDTTSEAFSGTVGQTVTINAPEIAGWVFAGYDDADGNTIATGDPEVKLTLSDDSSQNIIKLRYNINAGFTIAGPILNNNYWYSYDELVGMAQDAEKHDVLTANNYYTTKLYSVMKRGGVPGNMFGAGIDIATLLGDIGGSEPARVSLASTDGVTQSLTSQGNLKFDAKEFTYNLFYYPETLEKGAQASGAGATVVPPILAFKVNDISWVYDKVDAKGEPLPGAVVTYTPTLEGDVNPVQSRIIAETEDISQWEASAAYPYPLLMLGQAITGEYNNSSYFKMVHAITVGTVPTALTVKGKTENAKTYTAVSLSKVGFEKTGFDNNEEGIAADRLFARIPVSYTADDEITFLNGETPVITIKGSEAANCYVSLNVDRSTHILDKDVPIVLVYEKDGQTVKAPITNINLTEATTDPGHKEKGGDVENAVFYIAVQESVSGPISYYYYTQEELESYETTKDFLYDDHSVKKKVTAKGAALDELLADLEGVTITDEMIIQYAEEDGYHADQNTGIENSSYKDKVEWLGTAYDKGGTTLAPAQTMIAYLIHEEYETPDEYNVNDGVDVWKDADKSTGYLRAYRNTGSNKYDANIGGANATVIKYLMGVVVSSDGKLFSGKDGYVLQTVSDKNQGIAIRDAVNVTGLVPGMAYAVKAPAVVNAALADGEVNPQTIRVGTGTSQTVTFKYTEEPYFYVKNGTTTTNYTYTDMVAAGIQVPDKDANTAPYGYSRPMYYRYNGIWLETLLDGISDISSVKLIAKDGSETTVSAADIKDYFVAYNRTESKTSTNIPENKRVTTTYEDAKVIIPGEGENVTGSAPNDYSTAGKDVGILIAEAEGLIVTKVTSPTRPPSGGTGGSSVATTKPAIVIAETDTPLAEGAANLTDIANHWANGAINFVIGKGLFQGTTDTAFEPDRAMTRGMYVTVLGRLADGKPKAKSKFTDVPVDAYYADYVAWAEENGIVKGISEIKFAPNNEIVRQEMASIMYNYAVFTGVTSEGAIVTGAGIEEFADYSKVSEWAIPAMKWAYEIGLIQGKSNNLLDPLGTATRAEVATIMQRYCEFIALSNEGKTPLAASPTSSSTDSTSSSSGDSSAAKYTTVPTSGDYITIIGTAVKQPMYFTVDDFYDAGLVEYTYTGRNKENNNERQFIDAEGLTLKTLFKLAGWNKSAGNMKVVSSDGYTKVYDLDELMDGLVTFDSTDVTKSRKVPAIIALDGGSFRLVFGQLPDDSEENKDFNMQGWAKWVKEIEIY